MLNLDKQMTRIEHSQSKTKIEHSHIISILLLSLNARLLSLNYSKHQLVPSPHPSHQPSSINDIVRYMKELEDLTTAIKVSRRSPNPLLLQSLITPRSSPLQLQLPSLSSVLLLSSLLGKEIRISKDAERIL